MVVRQGLEEGGIVAKWQSALSVVVASSVRTACRLCACYVCIFQ